MKKSLTRIKRRLAEAGIPVVASPERSSWNHQSVLIHAQMVKKMGASNIVTGAKAGGVFNIQYELNGRSWRTSLLMA